MSKTEIKEKKPLPTGLFTPLQGTEIKNYAKLALEGNFYPFRIGDNNFEFNHPIHTLALGLYANAHDVSGERFGKMRVWVLVKRYGARNFPEGPVVFLLEEDEKKILELYRTARAVVT